MRGFILGDEPELVSLADRELTTWLDQGQLIVAEDILDGLETAPGGLIGLLAGENFGKRMVRVS
jgi:NADPH-dependent curcumin reductase CurA